MVARAMTVPPDDDKAEAQPSPRLPLLEVEELRTHFYTEQGELKAVDGVSFRLARGRTLGIVGESGCGKSVTAHSILRLIHPPGRIVGGSVRLHRRSAEEPLDILALGESSDELYDVRGGRAAFIFQEAMAALSPVHTIGNQLVEAIVLHQPLYQALSRRQARVLAADMLDRVGILNPESCLRQYPHELSVEMARRAIIAMALVTDPELLIADEPTTALDVTVQAQVLALLKKLQAELKMGILLITRDLGVVAQMADDVIVMYLGRVVERGSVRDILKKPRHPYSMGLLASLPALTPVGQRLPSIRGSVPASNAIPEGCPFHSRCPYTEMGRCNVGPPPPLERVSPMADEGEHAVACHRVREIALTRLLERNVEPVWDPASEALDAEAAKAIRAELPTLPDLELSEHELPTVPAPEVASVVTTVAAAALAQGSLPDGDLPDIDPAEAAWFEAGERASVEPVEEEPE